MWDFESRPDGMQTKYLGCQHRRLLRRRRRSSEQYVVALLSVCMCMHIGPEQDLDYSVSEAHLDHQGQGQYLLSKHIWYTKAEEIGGGDYGEEGSQ